jgi:hypothetical protein
VEHNGSGRNANHGVYKSAYRDSCVVPILTSCVASLLLLGPNAVHIYVQEHQDHPQWFIVLAYSQCGREEACFAT